MSRILIYQMTDGLSGTSLDQYRWINDSTPILFEDVGGSASWVFPDWTVGGGERIFSTGELDIVIVRHEADLAGEHVFFRAWGDPGFANKNVEFRRSAENEIPLAQATLIGAAGSGGPGPVPIRIGNILTSVDADGVTEYSTIWDITSDGVEMGDRAQLVPRIY